MGPGPAHDLMDLTGVPEHLLPYVILLDEFAHAPHNTLIPKPPSVLYVPIFLHQMSGMRGAPIFQSAPLNPPQNGMGGDVFMSPTLTLAGVYHYICGIHGAGMAGQIHGSAGRANHL